jgi:hypothetical protein
MKHKGIPIFCLFYYLFVFNTDKIFKFAAFRDVAQPGSVLAWGARGRKFESCHPDIYYKKPVRAFYVFNLSRKIQGYL